MNNTKISIRNECKPILVTGGCGFIGTNLVHRLTSEGRVVRVVDNLTRGRMEWIASTGAQLIIGDVRSAESLRRAMDGVEVVIHLAAYGSVVESVSDPESNYDNNVRGTFSVLDAARRSKVRTVIFASTGGAVIGDTEPPVDEKSLPKPISPYGASKLCGEAYCHAFGKAYGIRTLSLRFANVYGPHSAHKTGAITTFLKAVMSGKPMVIFGDGKASRDFLYVDDLCKGLQLGLYSDLPAGTVLHLASGVETEIAELARAVARASGQPQHPVEYRPRRVAEVERNCASYGLAYQLLGFEPEWSLDDGLRSTWQWFRCQGKAVVAEEVSDS